MSFHRISAIATTLLGLGLVTAACEDRTRRTDQDQPQTQTQPRNEQRPNESNNPTTQESSGNAQRQADDEAKLKKDVADYRAKIQKELADQDVKLDEMRANMKAAANKATAEEQRLFNDAIQHRATLDADLKKLDTVTRAEWEGVEAKIDKDVDEFKSSVRTASRNIKTTKPRTP